MNRSKNADFAERLSTAADAKKAQLERAARAGDDGPRELGGTASGTPLSRALVPSKVAIDQMHEAVALRPTR